MSTHVEGNNDEFERFNPEFDKGLSEEQVNQRIEQGKVNNYKAVVGKTVWEILRSNVFTFFNILLFSIAGFMIYANVNDNDPTTPWYSGLFFVSILIFNIAIGLYQDIKTKNLMVKMSILNRANVQVIRDGVKKEIPSTELVIDDVFCLESGDQIATDSIVLEGFLLVDESCLTGESHSIQKAVGDVLYSGTIVSSGRCHARVEKVGKDNSMEALSIKARTVKRNPSHILRSLKILFRILGTIIIISASTIILTYALHGSLSTKEDFVNVIRPFSGQFVAMIPAGLSLLSSVALVSGVLNLYKKGAYVQELFSIEMLARSDVLCVDKTGTITTGTMYVDRVELVDTNHKMTENEVGHIINNILKATGDNNVTAQALREKFGDNNNSTVATIKSLPFNSSNKYSGATFSTGITYLIGAFEKMSIEPAEKDRIKEIIDKWSSEGYRVLVSGKGTGDIKNDKYEGGIDPLALIILKDEIKKEAPPTFNWFEENGVAIKVISGDSLRTVQSVAEQAGIANADKAISLEGMTLDEVKAVALDYTVFCRVSPEQKEAIIVSLKDAGKTVAMTGDGVNDILALKHADCSIAMNSGTQAAKNVSHIVLRNNDFSAMPSIVAEGRRVINNLTRTGSLFLTKTFFAIALSVAFWLVSIFTANKYSYPFSTNNMLIWEVFGIGLSAFFVALEPDKSQIKRGFLRNIMKRAIPGAALMISAVFFSYLAYILQEQGVMYTGVGSFGYMTSNSSLMRTGATAIAVLSFSILSFVILYMVCRPLSKYRAIVISSAIAITAILYISIGALSPTKNVLGINFDMITYENLLLIGIIVVSLAAIMIFIQTLIYNIKELKKDDKNK